MKIPVEQMEKYIERRKIDLSDCLKLLELRNFDEIKKIGHKIQGNAVTFGFPELAMIGKRLESGAFDKNFVIIRNSLVEFSSWFGRCR